MLTQEKRHGATPRWTFNVIWAMAEQSGCLSERLAHCKDMKHHMLGSMLEFHCSVARRLPLLDTVLLTVYPIDMCSSDLCLGLAPSCDV